MTGLFSRRAGLLVFLVVCAAWRPATAATLRAFSFGWTFGSNSSVATPVDRSNLGGLAITQAAAGDSHSLLLAEDGRVFSFGEDSFGSLGLPGGSSGLAGTPTSIDTYYLGDRKITQVAAGLFHSLILAEDGSVFSFGWGLSGQTGLGIDGDNAATRSATPINTTNLGGRRIKQVAAGGQNSLLLAEDGSVFAFGANYEGRSGLGIEHGVTLVATPIDSSNLGGRKIKQVDVGDEHSLLLAEDGSVFAFGDNRFGEAGVGSDSDVISTPTPIDTSNLAGRKIKQVAAGQEFSLLLAEDGSVFAFGDNGAGKTGLGASSGATLVATPIDASNLGGRAITQVAAGWNHSLLLAEDGSVFSFGANYYGQAGLGPDSGNTLVATPIANPRGLTFTQVAAGSRHSLLVGVPEPCTLALLAVALLGVSGSARWQARRQGLDLRSFGARRAKGIVVDLTT